MNAPIASTEPRILPRLSVVTRDGVSLCTDVYLPETAGPHPVVLLRTPYGRTMPFLLLLARRLNQGGLAVVLQDLRGRYQSGGRFELRREGEDGQDTLKWLRAQPWANGRVGLIGLSLTSYVNAVLASQPPPGVEIQALVTLMGTVSCYEMFYRRGALVHHWALPWITMMSDGNMGRTGWRELPWDDLFRHLPLDSVIERTGGDRELWRDTIAHPAYGRFWEELDATARLRRLRVPTLHVGGWFDFMLDQTLTGYRVMTENGPHPEAPQKLILGPWDHESLFYSFGAGPASARSGIDLTDVVVGWLEAWLAPGRGLPAPSLPPNVLTYVQNSGAWMAAEEFPLPQSLHEDWYLASGGGANSTAGDGTLGPTRPRRAGQDSFRFDPDNPVPTRGGAVWPFPPTRLAAGPMEQNEVEARPDVLVYTSDPLTEARLVIGELRLVLWAATSARDTDFTAKLVDVGPGGAATIVQDGIVRGRFSGESAEPEGLLTPERPYRFEIDLAATAYRFPPGHRIRVEVSSSNFPKFDRNLNTGVPPDGATHARVARQRVFHGGSMASRLRLPIVPQGVFDSHRFRPQSYPWRAARRPSPPVGAAPDGR